MSKLEDILKLMKVEEYGIFPRSETVRQIKELFNELIGEDEVRPSEGPKRNGIEQGLRRARNRLRAELRLRVKNL